MEKIDRPRCSACGGIVAPYKFGLWRCNFCGSARVWPEKDDSALLAVYDGDYFDSKDKARGYFDLERIRKWKRSTAALLLRRLGRYFPDSLKRINVLDYGAGTGEFSAVAQERGMYVIAMEPNPAGRVLIPLPHGQVAAAPADIDLSMKFELIVLNDVVEHLPSPLNELNSLADRLSPDGIMVVTTPDFGGPFRYLLGGRWPHLKPDEHIHYFTRSGLRRLSAEAGLECLQVSAHFKIIGLDYLLRDQGRRGGILGRLARGIGSLLRVLVPIPVPAYLDEILMVARRKKPQDPEGVVRF